jgi:putative flippase GtrA
MIPVTHRRQYFIYCIVGAVIGLTAVIVRELLDCILPSEIPLYYGLSVMIVYAGGIIAGYYAHSKYTFRKRTVAGLHGRSFLVFILIAVFGMFLTAALALMFMYVLDFNRIFQQAGAAISFVIAVVLVSVVTYGLNVRFTFSGMHPLGGTDA